MLPGPTLMAKRSGASWALLLSLTAATSASFIPQSGLLYWCSLSEQGSNFQGVSDPSAPRTTWLNYASGTFSRMCHYQYVESSLQQYTFSNGSSYPQNNNGQWYAIQPNFCMVRGLYR